MKLALDIGADYIDNELYEWNQSNLLSKQFKNFTNFRVKNLMAICGCAFNPSALTAFVRLRGHLGQEVNENERNEK